MHALRLPFHAHDLHINLFDSVSILDDMIASRRRSIGHVGFTFMPQAQRRQIELLPGLHQRRHVVAPPPPRPDPPPLSRHPLQLESPRLHPLHHLVPVAPALLEPPRDLRQPRVDQHDQAPDADEQEQAEDVERSVRLRPHLDPMAQLLHGRARGLDDVVEHGQPGADVEVGGLCEGGRRALQRGQGRVHPVAGLALPVAAGQRGRQVEGERAVPQVVVRHQALPPDEDELEVDLREPVHLPHQVVHGFLPGPQAGEVLRRLDVVQAREGGALVRVGGAELVLFATGEPGLRVRRCEGAVAVEVCGGEVVGVEPWVFDRLAVRNSVDETDESEVGIGNLELGDRIEEGSLIARVIHKRRVGSLIGC